MDVFKIDHDTNLSDCPHLLGFTLYKKKLTPQVTIQIFVLFTLRCSNSQAFNILNLQAFIVV